MRHVTVYIFGLFLLTTSCGQVANNVSSGQTDKKGNALLFDQEAEQIVKSVEVSKEDFIYNDTINKFQIIVKSGFSYSTGNPTVQFMAFSNDTNNLSLSYTIKKNIATKEIIPGQFLNELQKTKPLKFHFSNIKLSDYINGYKIEEGKMIIEKDNASWFGTMKVYIKDKISYTIYITYASEEQFTQGANLTKEIFDSFAILE